MSVTVAVVLGNQRNMSYRFRLIYYFSLTMSFIFQKPVFKSLWII